MLTKIFEASGRVETFAKCFGYSGLLPTDQLRLVYHKVFQNKGEQVEVDPSLMDKVFAYVDSLGIRKGDVLIVHSSMEGMRRAAPEPRAIIDHLLELVGPEGLLVFPTFPIINHTYTPEKLQTYNPKRTPCWTGMLPNTFLTYPGVKRSLFPFNTLAAIGAGSDEMIVHNLEADRAHGKHSAWEYCVNRRAKILYLGVRVAECNTVMHVAEDLLDDKWPVKNWYQEQTYRIKNGTETFDKTIRACSTEWTKYTACYHHTAIMRRAGLVSETDIGGISVGFTPDAKKMVDFVAENALKGKIRYNIPRKYWK